MLTVKRTHEVEIQQSELQVGDVIHFTLANGEEAEAMAVKKEDDSMLMCFVDCLKEDAVMNERGTNKGGYAASDLRKKLNTEIFNLFPANLLEWMLPVFEDDLLRIPTEKEIFDTNCWSEDEPEAVQQWCCMKSRRNRIAFQGFGTDVWEWYWLMNEVEDSSADFCACYADGDCGYNCDFDSLGVRPVFRIRLS